MDAQVARADIFMGEACPKYRVGKDPWGFSFTLRKSDFQKAVRRGHVKQALVAFFVAYNMPALFPHATGAKSIRTNMLNRVLVCALEDIGVANCGLVYYIINMAERTWLRRKGTNPELLARVITAMCASKKTRIMSHMAHTFSEKNTALALEAGVDPTISPSTPLGGLEDPRWFRVLESAPEAAWRAMLRVVPCTFEALMKRMAARNRPAMSRFALAVAHFSAKGTLGVHELPSPLCRTLELPPCPYRVCDLLTNSIEAPPAPEAYDMHTPHGARGEEGKRVFRTQGARVHNQCARFYVRAYEEVYIKSKK